MGEINLVYELRIDDGDVKMISCQIGRAFLIQSGGEGEGEGKNQNQIRSKSRDFTIGPSIKNRETIKSSVIKDANSISNYLNGKSKNLYSPRLDFSVLTSFQRDVFDRLLILAPYGEVTTYGQLAKDLGRPKGARSVGQALAHNPFLLFFPCHRVVAKNGDLTGFRAEGSISTKEKLIQLERIFR